MVVKQRQRAQTEYIVREICRILSETGSKDRPFMVLSQLRDKIIAPAKQNELKSAWDDAISYIKQNDSRIQFGVDLVNGESVKGFRWIEDAAVAAKTSSQQKTPTLPRTSSYQPRNDAASYATVKKWRCSAFDHSNKIKDPPTNCLKIRQMVRQLTLILPASFSTFSLPVRQIRSKLFKSANNHPGYDSSQTQRQKLQNLRHPTGLENLLRLCQVRHCQMRRHRA